MQHVIETAKDTDHDLSRSTPDRSELADMLWQAGTPEGFSLEWVMDRFDQSRGRA